MSKADRTHYRTIWLSDVHLATRGCKADFLLDFLRHHESDYLYLVGDMVDGWRIKKNWFWLQSHNDVIQKLLRKARKGTKVWLLPGNHDEALRGFIGVQLGEIPIVEEIVHTTADGKRLLVLHGDRFDAVVRHAKWLALLGDGAYTMVLSINQWFNYVRRKLGYPYWSLSSYLKQKVKRACEFAANYQQALISEARHRGLDGVVCGHIHRPEIRHVDGILYCNDGDWVESCTALVEHHDGRLAIVEWAHIKDGTPDVEIEAAIHSGAVSPTAHPAAIS